MNDGPDTTRLTGLTGLLEARVKRFILITVILLVAAAAPILPQTQSGQLASVIQEGRRAAAFAMIQAGADVNEAQLDGTRPIHWAVYRVDYDLVDALIARKARVDVANEFGHTPLAEAVKQGDARMVKTLLGAGSGTEGANEDGQTALMVAIKNGDLPIFQMLIDAGAKVNVVEKVQDQTPLMWAAAATRNAAEMVKGLIAKGATVNARARFNDWPSQITSEPRGQYHAYGGLTPLLYAARGGCYACVEALVAAGADVNLPTPEGVSPIMIALDNGHNSVARLLMDRGGNPHVWDVYGRTALYIAVGNAGGGGGRGAAPARVDAVPGAGAGGRGVRARRSGWSRRRRWAWRWRYRGQRTADFSRGDDQTAVGVWRGHQRATQHASSQQSGRAFQRSAAQHRNDAAAARADQ